MACYNKNESERKDVSGVFTATVDKMFCKNCGTQLPDDSKFCVNCGAQIEAAVQPAEAPVAEPPAYEPQPVFAQPQFEAPVVAPKKKKIWLIPVIAIVVVVAVAAALLLGPLKGWWVKSFGSEEAYRDYVQENGTGSAIGSVSKAYGTILSSLSGENKTETGAADVTMKLNVGDKIVTMLEDLTKEELGEKIDMDWAKNIELKLSANVTEDLQQIGAALNISDKEIAVLDAILNMDKGKLFVAVTSMSNEYLEVDMSDYLPTNDSTPVWMQMLQDPKLIEALPTEAELDAVLDKYIAIVMDNFDDVEKSTEAVKIGQLEQKLTVLETKIDGEDVADALEDVLQAARKDQQIEKIIRKAAAYLETQEEFSDYVDADEVYDAFLDTIDEALNDLPDMDTEGESILLTQYINGSHEVVGYALTVDGEETVRCVEIRDGSKLAFELEVPGTLEILGAGTEKNGTVTADYTVAVDYPTFDEETYEVVYEKMDVVTVSLIDFKAEGETVNGKIRIAPTSDLLKTLGLSSAASSAIDLASLQLELGFATTKNGGSVEINILSGEDLLVGLSFTAAEKKASAISEPTDTCDVEDIEDWLEGLDVEKLVKALDDAGLPASEFIYGVSSDVQAEAVSPIY